MKNKIQFLPRFSDPNQRRIGGYILNFTVGLLVVTLIVRGTNAATLARVEIANPVRAEIVEAVTGKANVTVCDTLDISTPEGLTIEEIFVGQGRSVNVGDAIARFDMEELQEKLTRESVALDKLFFDLEKLERSENSDSASLESAGRSLLRAQEDYTAVKTQGEADVASAREALEEARESQAEDPDIAAINTARRNLERTREDYEAVAAQNNSDIAAAQDALDTAIKKQTESPNSNAMNTAYLNLSRAREDFNSAQALYDKDTADAFAAYHNAQNNASIKLSEWENADEADKPLAHQAYQEAQAVLVNALTTYETVRNRSEESLTSAKRRLEDATIAVQNAEQDYYKGSEQASDSRQTEIDKAREALESVGKRADENLLSASRRVEDAEIALQNAQEDYLKSSERASDTLQDEIDKAQDAYISAQKRANENLNNAARQIEDAEASLARAGRDYEKSEQQCVDTALQNNINAATLKLDIEEQKNLVDTLNLLIGTEGILYSDTGGIVSSVKSEGSTTNQDAIVAFMDSAKGFEANLQIDKSDADKLVVGEACEVTTGGGSMYYTPTVTGIISAISLPDEQDKVWVTIQLPDGDWSEGQRVDVQTVQDRSIYDLCVPKSALHSDNTGYYLLVVEQKNSVLGVENTAVKVYVNIVASDDDMAAVQGPVDRNSQVITGSTKAISAGDRVRMNDK